MINSNIVRYVKLSQLLASLTKPELRGELYTEREKLFAIFKKKADSSVWKRLVHKKLVPRVDYNAALVLQGGC